MILSGTGVGRRLCEQECVGGDWGSKKDVAEVVNESNEQRYYHGENIITQTKPVRLTRVKANIQFTNAHDRYK